LSAPARHPAAAPALTEAGSRRANVISRPTLCLVRSGEHFHDNRRTDRERRMPRVRCDVHGRLRPGWRSGGAGAHRNHQPQEGPSPTGSL